MPVDLLKLARVAVEQGDLQRAAVLFAEANLRQPSFIARAGASACARRMASLVHRIEDPGAPQDVQFHPNGRQLATAGRDGVRIWDLKNLPLCVHVQLPQPVTALTFAPAGRHLFAGDPDGGVERIDAESWKRKGLRTDLPGRIVRLVCSGNGRVLMAAASDGTVALLDGMDGKLRHLVKPRGAALRDACFAGGDERICIGRADGSLDFFDLARSSDPIATVDHGPDGINAVTCSRDGRLAASGGIDRVVQFWDLREFIRNGAGLPTRSATTSMALGPDGRRLAVGSRTGVVRLVKPGAAEWTGMLLNNPEPLHALAFSPGGGRLAVVGGSEISIWRLRAPALEPIVLNHPEPVSGIDVDGDRIITKFGAETRAWDLSTGERTPGTSVNCPAPPDEVTVPGGRIVIRVGVGEVQAWDRESGTPVGPPFKGAFSGLVLAEKAEKLIALSGRQVWILDIAFLFREEEARSLADRIRRQTGLSRDGTLKAAEWAGLKPRSADSPDKPPDLVRLAREEGDETRALATLNRAVEIDPKYAGAIFERAHIRSETGEILNALQDVERALEIDPAFAEALVQRARLKWLAGKPKQAVKDLDQAIEALPDLAAAYHERGRIRLELGDEKGGAADLRWAVELDPSLIDEVRLVMPRAAGDPRAAWEKYAESTVHFNRQDYEKAIPLLTEAIELWPEPVYYNDRGVSKHWLGKLESAIGDYRDAVRLDPTFAKAWQNFGLLLKDLGRYDEAIRPLERAMKLDPDREPKCLTLLSECEARLERPPRMERLADVNRALDEAAEAERAGNHGGAVAAYSRAIRIAPGLAALYLSRAAARRAGDDVDEALRDIDKAIELRPNYAIAHMERGRIHLERREHEQSVRASSAAVRADPHHPMPYNNRAAALMELGRLAEAIEDCSMAIRLDRNLAMAWSNRALARMDLKDYPGALADFRQSVHLEPARYLRFRQQMADSQVRVGLIPRQKRRAKDDPALTGGIEDYFAAEGMINEGRFAEAEPRFTQGLGKIDDLPSLFLGRGLSRHFQNRNEEAMEDFTRAVELWPEFAMALSNAANVCLELGREDEALRYIERGFAIEPDSPFFNFHRGRLHVTHKEYAEGIRRMDRSLELFPGQADVCWERGSAKWHLEDWAGVIEDLERAAQIDPDTYGEQKEQWVAQARARIEEA